MSDTSELLHKSALAHGEMLQRGELSCLEMTNHYLRLIDEKNPEYQAFTYVSKQRSRLAARQWDAARAKSKKAHAGPFAGVPTAMKDLSWVRMMPARLGSEAFRHFIAPKDDASTARVRGAGMIILGKLATSEFGALPITEPAFHPPTKNAIAPEYTAGGSSGGSGAAMGLGILPVAQGSDGGGSIRIPSALNHLVGFKHSRGVGVHDAPVDRKLRLSSSGPLARTVEDAAAFMDLLTAWPMGLRAQLSEPLPPLRIALSTSSPLATTEREHVEAAVRVASIFERAGCVVEQRPWIDLPVENFLQLWKRLMANVPVMSEKGVQPFTRWLRAEGKNITSDEATATRIAMERDILRWFGSYDLWISPTIASRAPKHGAAYGDTPAQTFANVMGLGAYTAPFNVSGQPAVSVPMGYLANGPAIGVQIAGRVGADALVLRAAKLVEDAVGGFWPPKHLA